ncbi:MAG: tetratricopeptide repeat protein [Pleurocapsa sp. MO_226.B13]|nr:tetratricopeptide repeat protein [Pleurocapsa sp. MO_226.B13]
MKRSSSKFAQVIGTLLVAIALETSAINAQPAQPQSAAEYLESGINLSEQNKFVDAIKAYSQAIELNPDNALIYYNRGLAFYHLRQHEPALHDFDKTIELNPDVVQPYMTRALILMYLEDYQGAIADFESAAKIDPEKPEAYSGRGFATMLNGQTAQAIPYFDRAIKLNPDLAIAYFVRGGAHSELGNRAAAVKDYQQAGRLYQKLENRASFDRVMAIVKDLLPSCHPNCNQTANNDAILTDREMLASATDSKPIANLEARISFGDKILVDRLTNPDKQSGVTAFAAGDFDTAITKLEASLQKYPNDPEALIYLNNARIGNSKSLSIAVSVPVDSVTPIALSMLRGVAQAQAEINNNGGINGTGLKIAIAADDDNPEMTKQLGSLLGKNPEILGVVGPYSSDASLVAGEAYRQEQLVAISPISTSVKLSNFSPYFFRTVPNDTVAAEALANYAIDRLQVKKAAILFNSKSAYSQSLKSEFLLALSKRGGRLVTTIDLSNPNFDAVESMKTAEENGAEFLMLAPNTLTLDKALEVVKANNQKLPMLAGDDVLQAKTRAVGGQDAVGMVLASPWYSGSDSTSDFQTRAQTLWGEEVEWRAALAYDATQALVTAMANNPTREGIRQTLEVFGFTANGASGTVSFLPSGDRLADVELVRLVASPKDKYGYTFMPLSKQPDNSKVKP